MRKRTKIVATLGPSVNKASIFSKLIDEGLNVVRLNFSYGEHKSHKETIKMIRSVSFKKKEHIPIIQDLTGPKIRIGEIKGGTLKLKKGDIFTFTPKKEDDLFSSTVNYQGFFNDVFKGHSILLDDGKIKMRAEKVIKGKKIVSKVICGGELKSNKGVNLPDSNVSVGTLTNKDKKDVLFGIKQKVDFVALSFVRSAKDVEGLRRIIKKNKGNSGIIAKIETAEAVDDIEEIIKVSDGIMVARGDLAVEIPTERVPTLQKKIVRKCQDSGRPVIIATQMLESMTSSQTPTRAEVSDVANAVFDGTDAVMLSAETAAGSFPVEVISVMNKIIKQVEGESRQRFDLRSSENGNKNVIDSITRSVVHIAHNIDAKAVVVLTNSGFTGRIISRHRSRLPILALSSDEETCRKLGLSFGCIPVFSPEIKTIEEAFSSVRKFCLKYELAKSGERVVIAAGVPFDKHNINTNMISVEVI